MKQHNHTSRQNGWSPTYSSWVGMRQRCDNSNSSRYKDYGGRGITYQKSWSDFRNFLADMDERPYGCSLDREDNNGNYTTENCRWATGTLQNLNSRIRKDNQCGVKGVSFKKQIGRWIARGQLNGESKLLYCGPSFEKACIAREDWELQILELLS